MEQITDGGNVLAVHIYLAVNRLVKMPRVAFVGQRGIKGKGVGRVFVVNINNIVGHIVDGRREIVSGAGIVFHGRRYAFNGVTGYETFPVCN